MPEGAEGRAGRGSARTGDRGSARTRGDGCTPRGDPQDFQRTSATGSPVEDLWVVTNALGEVEDLSTAMARLLNMSRRGTVGRNLAAHVVQNRAALLADLLRAAGGFRVDRTAVVRPRDRRTVRLHLTIAALPGRAGDRVRLHWRVRPVGGG